MLKKLRLTWKLVLILLIPMAALIINTYMSYSSTRALNEGKPQMIEAARSLLNADRDFYQARIAYYEILSLQPTDPSYGNLVREFESNTAQVIERAGRVQALVTNHPTLFGDVSLLREGFLRFQQHYSLWLEHAQATLIESASAEAELTDRDKAKMLSESDQLFNRARQDIDKLEGAIAAALDERLLADQAVADRSLSATVSAVGVALLVSLVLGILIVRSITLQR